jgi:hypothetical protein
VLEESAVNRRWVAGMGSVGGRKMVERAAWEAGKFGPTFGESNKQVKGLEGLVAKQRGS